MYFQATLLMQQDQCCTRCALAVLVAAHACMLELKSLGCGTAVNFKAKRSPFQLSTSQACWWIFQQWRTGCSSS
jgi:hypothetical protein